jgi:hypothetical protein
MNPERNDVNIAPLFSWGKSFELVDQDDMPLMEVHMRLVGDADLNRARIYALRTSAEKRKSLADKNSDDHIAFIQEEGALERERLLGMCVLFSSKDISQRALREIKIPFPKEPRSDAKQEDFEKYQEKVDKYPEVREAAIREFVKKELTLLEEKFKGYSDHDLYLTYVELVTNTLCEEVMLSAFTEKCAYFGTYKDKEFKTRLFKDFEDFQNQDGYLKEQFIIAYEALEIPTGELKKLREAVH